MTDQRANEAADWEAGREFSASETELASVNPKPSIVGRYRSGDGMADMRVLEARAVRRAGSSPVPSTIY